MNRAEILEKIGTILNSVLGHSNFELNEELTAKDADGWDSLTHMIIITEIESAFGVKFKLKDLNKLQNMGNLIDLVSGKLSEK
ncbi:acyl carrier protein [Flavobacterium wongokense]|uniref:acyl carrier protein n=1 Tax=Flavobacterium wongokense TaxID=2910674 RepID=UPI001F2A3B43|nr:acyl carrier protein [Flavobacterium sp. WG47]MCF6132539.1 acyl carrier protein [Flavobacterium sp. WG47]